MTPTRDYEEIQAGIAVRDEFGGEIARTNEASVAALSAERKAFIEARFVVAMRFRRSTEDINMQMLRLCQKPDFACEAVYIKPVARTPKDWSEWSKRDKLIKSDKDWPRGFSIRMIEAWIYLAGNIDAGSIVVSDDEMSRRTRVDVLDLERNTGYSRTLTTKKTVERRNPRKIDGEEVEPITTRQNSGGQIVYVYEATEAEVAQAEAAAVSKAIRTLGEKLMPPHHKAEWQEQIWNTLRNEAARDPDGEKKKLIRSFAEKGITPSMIEQYLGHSIDQCVPEELVTLRGIFVAISGGEARWSDVVSGPPEEGQPLTSAQKSLADRIAAQRRKAEQQSAPSQEQPKSEPEKPTEKSKEQAGTGSPAADTASGKPSGPSGPSEGPQASQQAPTAAKQAEKPAADPSGQQKMRPIPSYSAQDAPDSDLFEVGQRIRIDGKLVENTMNPGEAPYWKAIQEEAPAGDTQANGKPEPKADEKKNRRSGRNPGALDFGGGEK